jgi:hypothetical protein
MWVVWVIVIVVVALIGGWLLGGAFPSGAKIAARVVAILALGGFLSGWYAVARSAALTEWLTDGLERTPTDNGLVPYLRHVFYCHEHLDATQCPTAGITHDPPPPPPPFW